MSPSDFGVTPDLAVMDVSFISAKLIIPSVYSVLRNGSDFICLIKPQFEVGRSGIGKGGIVKDKKLRREAVDGVVDFAVTCGFKLCGVIESPILGGDGNTEYLAHFRKETAVDEKGYNSPE
jgi:23S rRNA (cytidine1920-2'-O)/16S rRNA (cytidine1409-2'-O)-methyltransferase